MNPLRLVRVRRPAELPDRELTRERRGRPRAPRRLRPGVRLPAARRAAGDVPARARVPAGDGAADRARSRSRRSGSCTSPTGSSSCGRCARTSGSTLRLWAEDLRAARPRPAVRRGRRGARRRRGRVARPQHVPAPRAAAARRRAASASEPPPRERGLARCPATSAAATRACPATTTRSTRTRCSPRRSASRARSRTGCGPRRAAWRRSRARCRTPTRSTCASSCRCGSRAGRRSRPPTARSPSTTPRPAAPRGNGQLSPRSRISACAESRLLELLDPELALDAGGALELDVAVVDDLEAVAPRVEEVEPAAGQDLQPLALDRGADGRLVVDDEAEVAAVVGALAAALARAPGTGRPCRRTPCRRRGRAA